MSGTTGEARLSRLGAKDLNNDGRIINLVIAGSSRFYDYSVIEEILDQWIEIEDFPDLIIVGGASGVDYLAERWATNNNIEFIIFSEFWDKPRPGLKDSGRGEAPLDLTEKLLESATHVLAFLSSESKWTKLVADEAHDRGIPTYVHHLDESD
ncbi:MAG: SLOG family protein [Candidatus Thalassarchaeaceae archaeon]